MWLPVSNWRRKCMTAASRSSSPLPGGVGVGVINEAKTRATKGVWVVGVDSDQYGQGIYSGNKSVILTSALKRVDSATYDMIKAENDGKFPGGQTLVFDAKKNGVGIPATNPNPGNLKSPRRLLKSSIS